MNTHNQQMKSDKQNDPTGSVGAFRVAAHVSAVFLICFVLQGCAETYGRYLSPAQLAQVHKGKSTKQDVVAALGNPDSSSVEMSGRTIFNYQYRKFTPAPVAIDDAPVVGNSGNMNQETCVIFNPSGIVTDIKSNTSSSVHRGKFGSDGTGAGTEAWAPAKLQGVPQQ